ncbi:hypothetical protein B1A99_14495 [Cohnella sp. CIP 111063]|nr:hypothetical protein B1A99_14495 [Cohnella sp. CIP 111063]
METAVYHQPPPQPPPNPPPKPPPQPPPPQPPPQPPPATVPSASRSNRTSGRIALVLAFLPRGCSRMSLSPEIRTSLPEATEPSLRTA